MQYTCNPNTQEADAGGLLQVWGQPALHSGTLFQKAKSKQKDYNLKYMLDFFNQVFKT